MVRMLLLATSGVLLWISTAGQTLSTRLSRDSALIGDTVSYSLLASGGGGAEIFFMELPDTLATRVEQWAAPRVDTLSNSSDGIQVRLRMLLTSYDSGMVELPRFGVLVRHAGVLDTLYSDSCRLYFRPVPRDASVEDIKDIRGPLAQRLTFADVWPWLLGAVLVVLLVVGFFWYRRYMRCGEVVSAKRRLVPADELALDRLRRLREEKIWRERGMKEFYTELSDTLREFLSSEFGMRTLECTSSKIVRDLRADARCEREWLKTVDTALHLADLTKFARFAPTEQDCLNTLESLETLVVAIHRSLNAEIHKEEEGAATSDTERAVLAKGTSEIEADKTQDAKRYGPIGRGGLDNLEETEGRES